MTFQPLLDRLIVRKLEQYESDGGVIIPEKVQDKSDRGVVVAVGPGRKSADGSVIPMTVKVGDRVIFDKVANQTITLNDKQYLVLYEAEVIGIL